MTAPKQRLFFCITLILFLFASSETLHDYQAEYSDDSSLKIKHEQLLAKIHNLESSIEKRSHEIYSKDERIKILETTVVEKSNSLASLHGEIQSLQQKKESFDAKEQVGEAHAQAGELEKQVENLKKEIARQNSEKDSLEARINVAETKIEELNVKLEQLQRIIKEQKIRIRNTERALQMAEEERTRVQFRAAHYSKELAEVHESWLPPWLAAHLVHCQSFMVTHWNVYGRPARDVAIQKALETEAQVRKWAWPYIDVVQTKWIPIIKEQWLTFVTNMEPHAQILTAKTVEIYDASKKTLKPHIVNIQTFVDPYIKEAKKLMKPYIDQLSKTLKPHLNKARVFLKPYTKKLLRGYRRFSKATLKYHRRVRADIHEMLKRNEFTRPFASNELVWFMASAFMVFPVMVLLSMVSALFSKKPRRRTRTSHTNHPRRRARRVHQDKANASR
ncbi:uncharacterized protein LOC112499999 [Cynara cardunculus var. scolymus]|uniref:uncharacterized protein LOC112499999 n=1 Tax=Cynara cardunculus var. scolymus TaxID=59895 RepID=UPI000D623328|nr:uncharacterized protein LOC112499999 [Cynara cardunculus var. scolymus]